MPDIRLDVGRSISPRLAYLFNGKGHRHFASSRIEKILTMQVVGTAACYSKRQHHKHYGYERLTDHRTAQV